MFILGQLHPQPPYNFQLTLDILRRFAHPSLEVVHDDALWRVLHHGDGLALLQITHSGTIDHPILTVATPQSIDPAGSATLLKTTAWMLAVNHSTEDFYRYARQQNTLWPVIEPLVGLRWLRTETVFEALMNTIIEQQIAWTTAQKAQGWLVEWGGHSITYQDKTYYAYPTPSQIAAATIEQLKPLKITFKRMGVMIDIATQVTQGTLNLEQLRQQSIETAYQTLVAIKGIGHWTATWTLQRAHGRHNFVGHNDVALQAAVRHYFFQDDRKISADDVKTFYSRYGDYAGIAANHTLMRWVLDRYPVLDGAADGTDSPMPQM